MATLLLRQKRFLLVLIVFFSYGTLFAEVKAAGKEWIDTSVLYMIDSFSGNTTYYLMCALKLARLMMIMTLLWNFIQMVIGTMEGRKVFIGSVTKWLFFLMALHLYPGFSYGLRRLAIEVGTGASGTSISGLTKALGNYMEELQALADAAKSGDVQVFERKIQGAEALYNMYKAEYDSAKKKYDDAVEKGSPLYKLTAQTNGLRDLELKMKNAAQEKKILYEQKDAVAANEAGESRTLRALKEVLIKDGASVLPKYKLKIGLTTADGKDTGLISPSAMFKVGSLAAQIMWEKEWENIHKIEEENKEEKSFLNPTKYMPVMNFPISKIFDLVLCLIAMIALLVVMAACLIQYIMALIEYTITSSFAIVLIPCMLFDPMKDMAQKVLPTLLAQTVKLIFVTMAIFFSCWSFLQLAMNLSEQASGFDLNTFAYVIFSGLLTAAFCVFAPKWAQTLLTGQPQMSMGEFVATAGATAAGAMAAGHAAAKGASMAKNGAQKGANVATNAAGNIAAMAGAGSAAKMDAAASGKGKLGQAMAAMKGAASEGGSRFMGSMKEKANDFIRGGGKGGKGGAGGLGERNKHSAADTTTGDTSNTRDFARHQTGTGEKDGSGNEKKRQSTIGEYLRAQAQSGVNNQKRRQGK